VLINETFNYDKDITIIVLLIPAETEANIKQLLKIIVG